MMRGETEAQALKTLFPLTHLRNERRLTISYAREKTLPSLLHIPFEFDTTEKRMSWLYN